MTAHVVSTALVGGHFFVYIIFIGDSSMFTLRPHQQRACDSMLKNEKGTVIIPTGGGKTMCMIQDTLTTFADNVDCTVVVVARADREPYVGRRPKIVEHIILGTH